ncbi:hypothetical protein Ndes2526B_g00689 [Nannochloris sp. 'desiccata']
MDTDDIYGDDLLGGAAVSPSQTQRTQPQEATTTDISQMAPDDLRAALLDWETTFQEERQDGGIFSGIVGTIQPFTVLNELRRAISSEQQARAETAALRQRLAGAAAEAAARVQEDVLLRKELLAARTSTDPSVLQLRQLLLEPAVNREFNRLSAATADATLEATALKNDIRLLHDIANNSSGGPRALTAKIKSLEEKCDALQQVSEEGEAAKIERALAMAKSQLEEMRRRYGELEDHTHSLEDEIEALQRDLVNAERRISAINSSTAGGEVRGAPYYHPGQQQQQQHPGGWSRGPPMQHQQHPPLPPSGGGDRGGGGGGGYYNRGPPPGQHHHQPQGMIGGGGGAGKRPREY